VALLPTTGQFPCALADASAGLASHTRSYALDDRLTDWDPVRAATRLMHARKWRRADRRA